MVTSHKVWGFLLLYGQMKIIVSVLYKS